jgi:hypothetical protein
MSIAHQGTTKSSDVRTKIRDSQVGIPKPIITCPKCGVSGGHGIMKRWHFDNCGARNRTEFQKYRRAVQRLTEQIYRDHVHLINPHNLMRTKCGILGGYQLDHIISVKAGFDSQCSAHEIACINNLQMLPWQENRAKGA